MQEWSGRKASEKRRRGQPEGQRSGVKGAGETSTDWHPKRRTAERLPFEEELPQDAAGGGLVKGESLKEKGCNKNQMREQGGGGQGNLGHSEAAANRADDFVGIGHVIMVA
jgi:hypothetical protein